MMRAPHPLARSLATITAAAALAAGGLACGESEEELTWFGVNTAQAIRSGTATPDRFYERLTGMGANILREDVNWNLVEPADDLWQWGYLDREIGAAPAEVEVILLFLNSPKWARDPAADQTVCGTAIASDCRMPPAEGRIREWQELVREALRRYGERVAAVEVWNEPNLKSFWRPGGDEPGRWARLVVATAEAVAQVDPSVPVVSGGLGIGALADPGGNVGTMQGPYLDAAYASTPDLADALDGIGIHAYGAQRAPDDPGGRFLEALEEIRTVRDRRDPGKPLWVTETGYFTAGPGAVSEAQQRDWLLQIYDELLAAPDVEAMIVHTLVDPAWRGPLTSLDERSFGVTASDPALEPKPAWTAFHRRFGR